MPNITEVRHQLKAIYWHAQKGNCSICGFPMRGWKSPKTTFEHVWPLASQCEGEQLGNVMLAHVQCNQKKAFDKPSESHLKKLEALNRSLGLPVSLVGHWEVV